MSISLQKGQKIDLTKGNPNLSKVLVGLGWDVNTQRGGSNFDLDASVFLLDSTGKCKSSKDFVYFGNLKAPGVKHFGDNLTGVGDGDDEVVSVEFSDIPSYVERIAFTVNIYQGEARHQNFGMVSNSFIRLVNPQTKEELMRYNLGNDYSKETGVIFAEIYKHNGEWKVSAVGNGFEGGLAAVKRNFGL